jgi:hypothetical protein
LSLAVARAVVRITGLVAVVVALVVTALPVAFLSLQVQLIPLQLALVALELGLGVQTEATPCSVRSHLLAVAAVAVTTATPLDKMAALAAAQVITALLLELGLLVRAIMAAQGRLFRQITLVVLVAVLVL